MLATVFFCQPIGQLLGMIVSLVVITASHKWISTDSEVCESDQCIQTLDRAWRWIVGFGSIPALIALFFRLTIPESPRYLLDVVGAVKSASKDTQDYYNGDAFGQSQELMEAGHHSPSDLHVEQPKPKSSTDGMPSPSLSMRAVSEPSERVVPVHSSSPSAHLSLHPLPSRSLTYNDDDGGYHPSRPAPKDINLDESSSHSAGPMALNEQQPPEASWQDLIDFFIKQKNWIYLVATSSSWFCLDVSLTTIFYP
jgi:MFS transporter, PHS family, inorganic phosphate transporter